jgi:hypothetical protein
MRRRALSPLIVLVAALAVFPSASEARSEVRRCGPQGASTLAVVDCARLPAVASIDPRYRAPRRQFRFSAAVSQECRPSELLFYAARDWLRLAVKLAEHASPCADYYISIPPLVADKTKPRPNQAWRFRLLGPRFHAVAEIHWTAWRNWVRTTGSTWYDAGVEARRRMAAAGYDAANGDTWAINEFPSSVRRDDGTARSDAREFVRGLYEGDGRPLQGAVFVIGVMHGTTNASLYKATLKEWLADTSFWLEVDRAVRFWGQEVYGDARRWGVAGADSSDRRDYLNDFLQHAARLGSLAPDQYAAARTFLERAHTPVANAGWQWPAGLGWTMISGDQMRHFVSSQTHALRNVAAARPGPERFGFAWAPNNATGMPEAEFLSQTDKLLDRLGTAIAESGSTWSFDPGIHACVSPAFHWCGAVVPGASFTDAWRIFAAWEWRSDLDSRLSSLAKRVRALARATSGAP